MEKYQDSMLSPKERAEDLLDKLSLEEKMAQIRGVWQSGGPDDDTENWIRGRGIGQISALPLQMEETEREEAIQWLHRLQERIMAESPHGIPAVFHMEGVNGAYFHGASNYPTGVSRGASFDPALEEEIGQNVAKIELAAGITQILAPVLDVARDPRMGRCGEAYGEDPSLGAAMGAAYTRGIQQAEEEGRRASATAKHFVGFHSSRGGIHGGGSSIGERELQEVYAKPFQAAISESGLRGVMPCYNVMDGMPFSASKRYLTGLLREEMGFEGVAVSDYCAVSQVYDTKKVGECYADAGEKCLSAGMDVELPNPMGFHNELEERFKNGSLDIGILDRAVLRILEEKFRMGLFEHPFGSLEKLQSALKEEKEKQTAKRSAAESIVLLKNDGLLPLYDREIKKIAVIGPHAANARFYFGGYTHLSMMESSKAARNTMAGVAQDAENRKKEVAMIPGTVVQLDEGDAFDSVLRWIDPDCPSLLSEMRRQYPDIEFTWAKGYPIAGDSDAFFADALKAAEDADLILMTLGGKYGTGSIATMGESAALSGAPDRKNGGAQKTDGRHPFRRKASLFRRGRQIHECDHRGILPGFLWRMGSDRRSLRRYQSLRTASGERGVQCGTDPRGIQPRKRQLLAPGRFDRIPGLCRLLPSSQISLWAWPFLHLVRLRRTDDRKRKCPCG